MSLLPRATHLGNLQTIEIYVYVDRPCLFSCRNATGHLFLAVWIDETEVDNLWLYVPVSESRFQAIRTGEVDLHDAFLGSEDGFVYQVQVSCDDRPDRVEVIPGDTLDRSWLPLMGERLSCEPQTLAILVN